jgi:uncharacterized protein
MDMTGEMFIPARRDRVWAALNDTEILKACIPGCESLESVSPTEMKAKAAVKLGPIAAKFAGGVTLSEIDPPNGYTISGEGSGGVAGFAKGGAKVSLADQDDGTMLRYTVNAQVGGKIAQLGARLIDSTAKSMAGQFFTKFAAQLETVPTVQHDVEVETVPAIEAPIQFKTVPPDAPVQQDPGPKSAARSGPGIGIWIAAAVAAVIVAVGLWRLAA